MSRFSLFIWYVSIGVLVFTLPACRSSAKPTQEDITGNWVERARSVENSNLCGSFEFFRDGSFEARNIPSEHFIGKDYKPTRINAHGTWALDTSSDDPLAVHRIDLVFAAIEGFPLGLESVLYISVHGDLLFHGIDNRVLFVKGEKCN